jgi:hypothetical protein
MAEAEFSDEYRRLSGGVLGAIFNGVSAALSEGPVPNELGLPRMADAAVWVATRLFGSREPKAHSGERGGIKKPRHFIAFNKAWSAACVAAGCLGRIAHDLRRSADAISFVPAYLNGWRCR